MLVPAAVPSSTRAGSGNSPVRVALALGSNLGDRRAQLDAAREHLKAVVDGLVVSSYHDTAPVGVGEQPRFLNAAAVGTTFLSARALLQRLLAIEQVFGRERPYPGAPRTIDLDLVLYGQAIIDEPALQVPHPRFRDRAFVLDPLAEIAADWLDPVTGLTIAALRAQLKG
jgi:2-amino-4-hydroxy-6-hydroxymethyldihydropteridine diphosphokinase